MGNKAAATVRFFAGGMHLPAMARIHSGTVFGRISPVLFGKRSPAATGEEEETQFDEKIFSKS